MAKLTHLSDEEVIAYFHFENMVEKEPDFCPLYKENRKCHDMEELNCYLCACPNFRFDDNGLEEIDGKSLKSRCGINSRDGSRFVGTDTIHQDCSGCLVPHCKTYIQEVFQREWFAMMHKVSSHAPVS
jgi:hypothetical protein